MGSNLESSSSFVLFFCLLACKHMHVAAPCLLLRHSFGLLAALAAITGMTWPNVARRSAEHGGNHPARRLPPSHTCAQRQKTSATDWTKNQRAECPNWIIDTLSWKNQQRSRDVRSTPVLLFCLSFRVVHYGPGSYFHPWEAALIWW